MFAVALNTFWTFSMAPPRRTSEPTPRCSTSVFIGDAVQPWGGETLLLEIIRRDAERRADQP